MTKQEVDVIVREVEVQKAIKDLHAERECLELLREMLHAQKVDLESREFVISRREATHQANADAANARLRDRRDK